MVDISKKKIGEVLDFLVILSIDYNVNLEDNSELSCLIRHLEHKSGIKGTADRTKRIEEEGLNEW